MLQQRQNISPKRPRFSEHMRLLIYSYLDTKTCINRISILNKKERESLMNSYFVREGRSHNFEFEDDYIMGSYVPDRL